MPRLRIKGRANYDGIVGKSFDVVVEVSDTSLSSKKIEAIRAQHPNWTAICCDSWTEV
ncbi:hypothetical protein [uncultured Prevotella sp.]|uniref:hypothetical protein n=1 Tax=uncultured Prevotella sp. TaxID=159272 RepID=UPI00262FCD7D|nr:hypothetical protein [uncultured Prevotella sp.]